MMIEDKSPPSRLVLVTLEAAQRAVWRARWHAFWWGQVAGVIATIGAGLLARAVYVAWVATGQ